MDAQDHDPAATRGEFDENAKEGAPELPGPVARGLDDVTVGADVADEELSPWYGDLVEEESESGADGSEDLSPDVPESPPDVAMAATRIRRPHPLDDEGIAAPQVRARRKGKRLIKPEWRERRLFTPEQRVLILDTWIRSGLPACDYAPLVEVSPHTLYSWKKRFEDEGPAGLVDKARGGKKGSKLPEATKRAILMLKEGNPDFGVHRISDMLLRGPALQASPGAVSRVLHEAGYVTEDVPTAKHDPKTVRYEREHPNDLWQTDIFTFTLKRTNRRVHLVAFMDDHSRFIVGYGLHASQSTALVLEGLRSAITSYGTPEEVLTDNGAQYITWRGKSAFTKECQKRGIRQIVSRPRRPQTLGKIERFWGTLWRECVQAAVFVDLGDARTRIGHYIDYYNFQRSHTSLEGLVPADRFFGAASDVLRTLKERVAANALEIARNGAPKTPFYLTGNVGGKPFSVHAEGERLVLRRAGEDATEIELASPPEEAKTEDPDAPPLSTEEERSADDEGVGDVSGPPELPEPVSPAGVVGGKATGLEALAEEASRPEQSDPDDDEAIPPLMSERAKRICASLLSADEEGASDEDVPGPPRLHPPGTRAGFPADDRPADAVEFEVRDGAQQRLQRKEPHGRRNLPQVIGPERVVPVLDRHAHPDVVGPRKLSSEGHEPRRPLREDLEAVPPRPRHDLEDLPYELQGDVAMEEVAHRVHEDCPRLPPPQGGVEHVFVKRQAEAVVRACRTMRHGVPCSGRAP